MRKVFRTAVLAGLSTMTVLVSGCTVPRPVVTFYGDRRAVDVGAELWCEVNNAALTVSCPPEPDTSADGHLSMLPGQPLQINVPTEIGDTPWLVVFEYLDAAGHPASGRSAVFTDNRLAYTLPSLGPKTVWTRVEVQAGLVPTLDAAGKTDIAASRAWVLTVTRKQVSPTAD